MRTKLYVAAALAGSLSLAVAACGSGEPTQDTSEPDVPAEDITISSDETSSPAEAATDAVPMKSPVAAAPKDIIRGKGGLEEKCLKAVADQGTTVIGTNRIEESEAAIAIYVNVEGGQAPWRCLGYKDGTIGEVMYTGSEGAL